VDGPLADAGYGTVEATVHRLPKEKSQFPAWRMRQGKLSVSGLSFERMVRTVFHSRAFGAKSIDLMLSALSSERLFFLNTDRR
jgi:hypothetical protein